jgi:hypothetical protein
MASIPTWAPSDEGQSVEGTHGNESASEATAGVQNCTTCHQEDLYLHLSQILNCEISHHKRTRAELYAEYHRRCELESLVQQQAQTISRWQEACEEVYASLEGHRMQNVTMQGEMEALAAEIDRCKEVRIVVSHDLVANKG